MADRSQALLERIELARASRTTLCIRGHGSKSDLSGSRRGDVVLDTTLHNGIERYRPEELVITVRAGTSLAEVNAALAEHGQQFASDPPEYGGRGTIGGAVASGLSGPSRPFCGSLRDVVLGVEMVNGLGERLRFGGEVFKNVAGFDVSRLMAGSEGAFGLLLGVSLRVAPVPECVAARRREMSAGDAVNLMRTWAVKPLPLTGLAYADGQLHWRLAGSQPVVAAALAMLPGDDEAPDFWARLRDRGLPCLNQPGLARVPKPPATTPDENDVCIDWAGSLRWTRAAHPGAEGCPVGTSPMLRMAENPLIRRIKAAFDPQGIFNPDLIHADTAA